MSTTPINWWAAALLALLLSAAHLLDGPEGLGGAVDQALDVQDAVKMEAERRHFETAAQALCGPNAAWADLGGGTVQCRTKRGHKTIVAQVTP